MHLGQKVAIKFLRKDAAKGQAPPVVVAPPSRPSWTGAPARPAAPKPAPQPAQPKPDDLLLDRK
jgi:hypothetical protein